MADSFSQIGKDLGKNMINTTSNVARTVGDGVEGVTKVGHTGVKGSLKAADEVVGATTVAVGDVGVSGAKVVGTAAKAVAGTADTMYKTAAKITEVAAAKGEAIAAKSIAANEAKTEAIQDPANIEKRKEAAREEEDLNLTKDKYKTEQDTLTAEAKRQTDLMNSQIEKVKRNTNETGQLNKEQNIALIAAAKAQEMLLKAQTTAGRIEKEAKEYHECRLVLQISADKPLASDNDVPNNTDAQKKFCKNKKICNSTGKPHSMFNFRQSNEKTCADIRTKYATFKTMSEETIGGRKTARKRIKRKNNTRRPKKNTRKPKKNTRKPKKNTRKPKKNTRRTKKTRRSKRHSI